MGYLAPQRTMERRGSTGCKKDCPKDVRSHTHTSYYGLTDILCRDRNWPEFLSVLDATFCSVGLCTGLNPSESAKTECLESISTTRELFTRLSKQDGRNDRSAPLALMELEKRARSHGLSTGWRNEQLSCWTGTESLKNIFQTRMQWFSWWRDTLTYLGTKHAVLKIWNHTFHLIRPISCDGLLSWNQYLFVR